MDEYDAKASKLIYDALHNNLVHLQKWDIDECFAGEFPRYFEADTLGEIVGYVKSARGKIKAVLIFVDGDTAICEVSEAVKAIEPYCTADCVGGGKFLFGCSDESEEKKFRLLLSFEQPTKRA